MTNTPDTLREIDLVQQSPQKDGVGHALGAVTECSHTPGPWKVFTTPDGSQVIGIGEATGEGVADCGFGIWRGGDAEALANAYLIAAAPTMFEALQEADNDLCGAGWGERSIVRSKIAQALLLARGDAA